MTIVLNLMGPPGTGKSTLASEIFSKLKWKGVNCELVSEFAKELVWEERQETMKDELYLFAKQNHRLFRVNGKVDVIVTDRPLILSLMYNAIYGDNSEEFGNLVLHETRKYRNCNVLLKRVKEYKTEGRLQTEEESDRMYNLIESILQVNNESYSTFDATTESADIMVDDIIKSLENRK